MVIYNYKLSIFRFKNKQQQKSDGYLTNAPTHVKVTSDVLKIHQ